MQSAKILKMIACERHDFETPNKIMYLECPKFIEISF